MQCISVNLKVWLPGHHQMTKKCNKSIMLIPLLIPVCCLTLIIRLYILCSQTTTENGFIVCVGDVPPRETNVCTTNYLVYY